MAQQVLPPPFVVVSRLIRLLTSLLRLSLQMDLR
jgi:hypothetical protein